MLRGQVHQQIEGRLVQPLQVVDEQHERAFGAGKSAQRALEHAAKAVLGLVRGDRRHGGLRIDQQFELRDELEQELPIHADCTPQRFAQPSERRVVLLQHVAQQLLERFCDGRVGPIALVLVELSTGEQRAAPARSLVVQLELTPQTRFTDPRRAGKSARFANHPWRRRGARTEASRALSVCLPYSR